MFTHGLDYGLSSNTGDRTDVQGLCCTRCRKSVNGEKKFERTWQLRARPKREVRQHRRRRATPQESWPWSGNLGGRAAVIGRGTRRRAATMAAAGNSQKKIDRQSGRNEEREQIPNGSMDLSQSYTHTLTNKSSARLRDQTRSDSNDGGRRCQWRQQQR